MKIKELIKKEKSSARGGKRKGVSKMKKIMIISIILFVAVMFSIKSYADMITDYNDKLVAGIVNPAPTGSPPVFNITGSGITLDPGDLKYYLRRMTATSYKVYIYGDVVGVDLRGGLDVCLDYFDLKDPTSITVGPNATLVSTSKYNEPTEAYNVEAFIEAYGIVPAWTGSFVEPDARLLATIDGTNSEAFYAIQVVSNAGTSYQSVIDTMDVDSCPHNWSDPPAPLAV